MQSEQYRFGPFLLDVDERRLLRDGEAVALKPRTFDLLVLFVRRAGRLVSKEDLLREVWSDAAVSDGALTQTIWQLRRALGEDDAAPRIETVPRAGYRFLAEVEAVAASPPPAAAESLVSVVLPAPSNAPAEPAAERAAAAVPPAPRTGRRLSPWFIAAAALALAAVGALATLVSEPSANQAATAFRSIRPHHLPGLGPHALPLVAPDGSTVLVRSNDIDFDRLWVVQPATGATREVTQGRELYATLELAPEGQMVYFTLRGLREPAPPILYRAPILGGPAEKVLDGVPPDFALSADGTRVAYLWGELGETDLVIAPLDGGERRVLPLSRVAEWYTFPAWSPDGNEIALSRGIGGDRDCVATVDTKTGEESILADQGWNAVGDKVWLPDGSGVVAIVRAPSEANMIAVIDRATGNVRALTQGTDEYSPWALSISADGRLLAASVARWQGELWLYEGPAAHGRRLGAEWMRPARFFGAGEVLFRSGRIGSRIWAQDIATAQRRAFTREGEDVEAAPTRDGEALVLLTSRGTTQDLWLASRDGRQMNRIALDRLVGDPAVSPDGRWVYYVAAPRGALERMPVAGGASEHLAGGLVRRPRPSPDGQWLAYWRQARSLQSAELEVVPAGGGAARVYELPRSASRWGPLGWTLDSQSILFVTEDEEGPAIAQVALGGGAVRPFMRFPEHRRDVISDFDLRADGAVLVGRGQWHALPLLIEDVP